MEGRCCSGGRSRPPLRPGLIPAGGWSAAQAAPRPASPCPVMLGVRPWLVPAQVPRLPGQRPLGGPECCAGTRSDLGSGHRAFLPPWRQLLPLASSEEGPGRHLSSQPGSCLSALLEVWTKEERVAPTGSSGVCLPALPCLCLLNGPRPRSGPRPGPRHPAPCCAGHAATPAPQPRASARTKGVDA